MIKRIFACLVFIPLIYACTSYKDITYVKDVGKTPNDTLYTNLTNSLESLNVLLKDMKTNPKRYVHFSVFGKKSTPSK